MRELYGRIGSQGEGLGVALVLICFGKRATAPAFERELSIQPLAICVKAPAQPCELPWHQANRFSWLTVSSCTVIKSY
jgi:hypothetical protein